MKRLLIWSIIGATILSLIFLIGCKGVDKNKPMARIEDKIITIGDFLEYYSRASKEQNPENRPPMETVENVKDFLKIILTKEAMFLEAEKLGYFDDPKFQDNYNDKVKELTQKALYDEVTSAVTVDEQEIKDFYTIALKEYNVYIIHTLTMNDANKALEQINAGADFLEVLKTTSVDYHPDMPLEPAAIRYGLDDIHKAIFALNPGEVTKPLADPNGQGYFVFKLDNISDFNPGEYENVKDRIYNYILDFKKKGVFDEYLNNLLTEHHYQVNEDAVNLLLTGTADDMKKAAAEKMPLVSADNVDYDVSALAPDGVLPAGAESQRLTNPDLVRSLMETRMKELVSNALFENEAKAKDYIDNEDIAKQLLEMKEKYAIDTLYRNLFYTQIPQPTKDEVIAYFNANPDKFSGKECIKAVLIRVATEEEAKNVIAEVDQTGNRTKAVKEYSIDAASRDNEMSPGMITLYHDDQNYPEDSQVAFTLQPGTHSEPIATPKGYDIIWAVQRIDAYQDDINEQKTYDKAVNYIMSERESSAETDEKCRLWMNDILNHYQWEIYEDTFPEVLKTIKDMQKESETE
jgi:parvulin-like peptidyl-prolyl isomerase